MKIEALNEAIDWSQWSDKQLDAAAALGLGPKYKPTPRRLFECGDCHKNIAYYKTFGSDTSYEETTKYCPECGWTEKNV